MSDATPDTAAPSEPPAVLTEAPPVSYARRVNTVSPGTQVRIWSTAILSICGSMLALGLWMTPSPEGLGTHAENLHIPPCGFYQLTHTPCPTCGCTTAVTWVAHGHLLKAFLTQPFGAVVGLMALALTVLSLIGLITGRWFGPKPFTIAWHWRSLTVGLAVLMAGAWVYKIAVVRLGLGW